MTAAAIERRPFKLVMKLPDGVSFRTVTSADETLAEKSRSPAFRRARWCTASTSARPVRTANSSGSPASAWPTGQWKLVGSTNELAYSADPESDRGTRRVSDGRGGHLDVYSVDEFVTPSREVPVKAYAGASLAMLLGGVPPLGTGADWYRPVRVKFVFE